MVIHNRMVIITIIIMIIKKLYISIGKLVSTHATVCTSFNTAGSKGTGAKHPPSQWGTAYANHPDPEAMHAGIVYHWAPLQIKWLPG